jgi:hypothetical protein
VIAGVRVVVGVLSPHETSRTERRARKEKRKDLESENDFGLRGFTQNLEYP